jgi:hypothetical protein
VIFNAAREQVNAAGPEQTGAGKPNDCGLEAITN